MKDIDKPEQIQQKTNRMLRAGEFACEEMLRDLELFSLEEMRCGFRVPKSSPPVPKRTSLKRQSQAFHSGTWWENEKKTGIK